MQPDNIIAAIRDRLTALATAEAAMPEESLSVKQYYLSYGETGDGEYFYDLCPEGCAALARFETQQYADGIAALRNAAPGLLAGYSATVDTCEGWLATHYGGITAQHYEDCALTILRGIAAALGVTTEVTE